MIGEDVQQMEKTKLIEEGISPYDSTVVCVPKADRILQVCISFQMISKDIIYYAYHMH